MKSQRQAARRFVEYWTFQRGSEKGEDQQFWNSLLGEVLGMEDVKSRVQYQVPVPVGRGVHDAPRTTKFLDAWIPETRVLIEHKSRGVNLDAPQAGHGGQTPYEQAAEYDNARPFDEKARWIVTCNFDEFRIYDRTKPLAPPLTLKLGNLPKEAHRLAFLVNPKEKAVDRELEISVQAGRIVGEIYDALLGRYSGNLAALNRLCVRLVFCLYAEDADIFPKDCFRRLLEASDERRLRNDLQRLFQTLDTPPAARDPYLEPELAVFPYTNGGLFKGSDAIPPLTEEVRQLLIGASQFDWRDITPTIFGALFESTLNPETRRAGGMVYTSVENIHKVIDPLFLDDLARRVDECVATCVATASSPSHSSLHSPRDAEAASPRIGASCVATAPSPSHSPRSAASRRRMLLALQEEMASLAFLDPACGSGNFLTETYLSLRRLENRIIAALQQGQGELDIGANRVRVSISQFHGIEINDFAVAVAKTAMWIAEAQMMRETADILHREPDYLPLRDYDGIVEGNALRMDWQHTAYIMGNPPFRGARNKSPEQAADMESVFGKDWKGFGNLDYVTAWYKKAAELGCRCAFVSTNSICQGDGVATLWKPLAERYGVEIDFAHRTFRWDNEASEKAHVHCVIVGFHAEEDGASRTPRPTDCPVPVGRGLWTRRTKTIFDHGRAIPAAHINAYLMDAPDAWVESRSKPLCDVPPMGIGNKPIDGGNYLFTPEEKAAFLQKEPQAERYFRRWYGSEEFINGKERWCLWLGDCTPQELFAMPECLKRVQAVREFRLASKSEGTRKIADRPTRFHVENMPRDSYLLVPSVSSERRRYVPMAFLPSDVIASNLALIIPSATLYHFGVLTSSVHMAWMRAVAGRLKSDYRYSAQIVYNNFPWPCVATAPSPSHSPCDAGAASPRIGAPPPSPSHSPCDAGAASPRIGAPPPRWRLSQLGPSPRSAASCVATAPSPSQKIAATAQAILDARAKYPGATLAQMYGDKMYLFPELVAAHEANDRAVLAAYGLKPDASEPEIVARLFGLHNVHF